MVTRFTQQTCIQLHGKKKDTFLSSAVRRCVQNIWLLHLGQPPLNIPCPWILPAPGGDLGLEDWLIGLLLRAKATLWPKDEEKKKCNLLFLSFTTTLPPLGFYYVAENWEAVCWNCHTNSNRLLSWVKHWRSGAIWDLFFHPSPSFVLFGTAGFER